MLRFFEGFAFVMKAAAVATGLFLAFKLGAALMLMAAQMRTLTFATVLFNASALLIPIAIGAFAAALVLTGDEIVTFINHGDKADSFLGRLAKKFPLVGKAIELVLSPFKKLGTFLGQAVGFIVQLVTGADNLQEAFDNIDLVSGLKDQFKDIVKAWEEFKVGFGLAVDMGANAAGSAFDSASSVVGQTVSDAATSIDQSVRTVFNIDATRMDSGELNAAIDQRMGLKNSEAVQANSTGKAM